MRLEADDDTRRQTELWSPKRERVLLNGKKQQNLNTKVTKGLAEQQGTTTQDLPELPREARRQTPGTIGRTGGWTRFPHMKMDDE